MRSLPPPADAASPPVGREEDVPARRGAVDSSLEATAVFHVERLPPPTCRTVLAPPAFPRRGAAPAPHFAASAVGREVAFRIDALAPHSARAHLEAIPVGRLGQTGSAETAGTRVSPGRTAGASIGAPEVDSPPRTAAAARWAAASAWPLLALLWIYRRFVSPVLPPACRYHPSCSQYAVEAVVAHGPIRGAWMALRRLARCHPWAAGGPDPVPPPRRLPDPEREKR